MIKLSDMYEIFTRDDPEDDWTWRMQSIGKEYLKTRGHDWIRLGFVKEFEIRQKGA